MNRRHGQCGKIKASRESIFIGDIHRSISASYIMLRALHVFHELDSFVSTPGPRGSTGVLKEEAYGQLQLVTTSQQ